MGLPSGSPFLLRYSVFSKIKNFTLPPRHNSPFVLGVPIRHTFTFISGCSFVSSADSVGAKRLPPAISAPNEVDVGSTSPGSPVLTVARIGCLFSSDCRQSLAPLQGRGAGLPQASLRGFILVAVRQHIECETHIKNSPQNVIKRII